MEAKASLLYFCLAMARHLDQGLHLLQALDLNIVQREHLLGELLEGSQLVLLDVGEPLLRETEHKERPLSSPVHDDRTEAAGGTLPLASDPQLDDPATEIGIDQAFLGIGDRLAQRRVVDILCGRESYEPLVLEDSHPPRSPVFGIYHTLCDSQDVRQARRRCTRL